MVFNALPTTEENWRRQCKYQHGYIKIRQKETQNENQHTVYITESITVRFVCVYACKYDTYARQVCVGV